MNNKFKITVIALACVFSGIANAVPQKEASNDQYANGRALVEMGQQARVEVSKQQFSSVKEKNKFYRRTLADIYEKNSALTPKEAQQSRNYSASDEYDAGVLPGRDAKLWTNAIVNCGVDGGEDELMDFYREAEESNLYRVSYLHPEDNFRSLFFDPSFNRLVPLGQITDRTVYLFKNTVSKTFADLNLKDTGGGAALHMLPNSPHFKEVLVVFKAEYLKRGVVLEYAPEKVTFVDPKSPVVRDYLVSIKVHNKVIKAAQQVKTCDVKFIKDAFKEAKSEVATLQSCTGKLHASLPFLNPPVALNCDGQDFSIIGGWNGK